MGKVTAEVSFSQDRESSASFLTLWVHVAMDHCVVYLWPSVPNLVRF